ncbi:MAG: sigma 54-interacting transcriptional regulator [Planctomycetes bacterium]|nr:sigma 54-interacting transcriptional regulator [Planctomycetota bacterium]
MSLSDNQERLKVLIVDDETALAEAMAEALERAGYEVITASSGDEGLRLLERQEPSIVLTDLKMDGIDGLALLKHAKADFQDVEVVVITGHGDVKTAVEAMRAGATNYVQKPVGLEELRAMVDKAAEHFQLLRDNRQLKQQLDEKFGFEGLIGNSPKFLDVINRLKSIAPTSATVLIQGETGTGKELIAKAIHNNSARKPKHFVPMNCTAINENLLEDELFGHEPHSFTGADKLRKGRFEYANGGTLFLDEIGDMPLNLQAKLLRVLENQEVTRIGSNEPIKVNVRLISATHRDLEAAVAAGTFREDLYYRLKVVTIKLPALRERKSDIPLLVAHFIKESAQRYGKKVVGVAEPLRRAMDEYDWKGNVRELRNAIDSMVVLDQDGTLNLNDVEEGSPLKRGHTRPLSLDNLVGKPISEIERFYSEKTLDFTEGNREEAARILGIGERTLYRMIQDWKLQDKIKEALAAAKGDLDAAAKILNTKPQALERKMKKWGMIP